MATAKVKAAASRAADQVLGVAEIIRAAVQVADAEGLAAVSMSRVAAQLGNSTMALYRHIRSKEELLLLMSDAALVDPPELPSDDWRAALGTWVHALLDLLRTHPWYAQLPLNGPPVGPHSLAWFDRGLSALAGTGLAAADQIAVVMSALTYVHGEIRLGGALAAGHAKDPDAFGSRYGAALAQVVTPARFPALSAVVATGVFDQESNLPDDLNSDFEVGLTCLLDGVAALIDRRNP